MKSILFILVIIIIFSPLSASCAQAENPDWEKQIQEELEEGVGYQVDSLDTADWDFLLKKIKEQGNPFIEETSVKSIIRKLLTGDYQLRADDFINQIGKVFFHELMLNLSLIAKITALAIISGILKNLQTSLDNQSVGEIAWFTCYAVMVILIIQSFSLIMDTGKQAIEQMVMFMQVIFPTLLTLLIAMGGIASSGILQPAIALLVGTMSSFMKNTMLPLILLSGVLTIINHISDRIKLGSLCKLTKDLCGWTLGILFTVFVGVLTIQGVLAASFDGISIRTAKYAIETFVPIVGGMFSQTVDMIIGCSLLVKNAVGVAGLVIIVFISLFPALKILSLAAVYKLSAALLEPISDQRISDCLSDMGGILTVLFITVSGVALMFFITITLLIGAGNVTVMMR